MRGRVDPQESMFSYFSPESRVPEGHPLRRIKQHADVVLASMNPEFDRIYAEFEVGARTLNNVKSTAVDLTLKRQGPDLTGSLGASTMRSPTTSRCSRLASSATRRTGA